MKMKKNMKNPIGTIWCFLPTAFRGTGAAALLTFLLALLLPAATGAATAPRGDDYTEIAIASDEVEVDDAVIEQWEAVQGRPTSYNYQRGEEAMNEGNLEEGEKYMLKELETNPENGYANLALSIIRMNQNQPGEALSYINKGIKYIPSIDKEYRSLAHLWRASVYLILTDTVKGLSDLDTALGLSPEDYTLLKTRAQLYYEMGQYDDSDADYGKILDIDETSVVGMVGIGRNAAKRENYAEAEKLYDKVTTLYPDYTGVYNFRAEARLKQEKYAEAAADIVKSAESSLDDHGSRLFVNWPKAGVPALKTQLKVAMVKQPDNTSWPWLMGFLLTKNDQFAEAVTYFEKGLKLDANSIFLEQMAYCYEKMGQYDKALHAIEQAQELAPDDTDLIVAKAQVLRALGRTDEAMAELNGYVEKTPDASRAYYLRGIDNFKNGETEAALEDFDMASALEPDAWQVKIWRGDSYRRLGREEEAVADYEAVLAVDIVPDGNSWRMFALQRLGRNDEAREWMRQMLKKDPTNSYYNAACLYSLLGEPEFATGYLKKAFEHGYRDFMSIDDDLDFDNVRHNPAFAALVQEWKGKFFSNPAGKEEIGGKGNKRKEKKEKEKKKRKYNDTGEAVGAPVVSEVPFTAEGGGTCMVKCTINGLPLHFIFDTGASTVSLSMVEANFMLKNGYIKPRDFKGSGQFVDANGNVTEGALVTLRDVEFGGCKLDNVKASVVANQKAPLLLGQSVLGRLGRIEIDNDAAVLRITPRK